MFAQAISRSKAESVTNNRRPYCIVHLHLLDAHGRRRQVDVLAGDFLSASNQCAVATLARAIASRWLPQPCLQFNREPSLHLGRRGSGLESPDQIKPLDVRR